MREAYQSDYSIKKISIDYFRKIRYCRSKLKGKPLEMMGHKATGSKRRMPQDSLTARLN